MAKYGKRLTLTMLFVFAETWQHCEKVRKNTSDENVKKATAAQNEFLKYPPKCLGVVGIKIC